METTTHTIGDLISAYSDMLAYMRLDAESHSEADCEPDDDFCPVRIYDEALSIYEDHRLFRLLNAAPGLLEACYAALELRCPDGDDHECGTFAVIKDAIAAATAEAATTSHPSPSADTSQN